MTYIKQQFVLDLDEDYEDEKKNRMDDIRMNEIRMVGSNFLEYQEVELTEEMIDNYFGIKKSKIDSSRINNSKLVDEQDGIQDNESNQQLGAVEISNEEDEKQVEQQVENQVGVDSNLSGGRKLEDVIEDLSGKRKINLTGGLQSIPNEKLLVYPYSLF